MFEFIKKKKSIFFILISVFFLIFVVTPFFVYVTLLLMGDLDIFYTMGHWVEANKINLLAWRLFLYSIILGYFYKFHKVLLKMMFVSCFGYEILLCQKLFLFN